jgi:hypothetical protein
MGINEIASRSGGCDPLGGVEGNVAEKRIFQMPTSVIEFLSSSYFTVLVAYLMMMSVWGLYSVDQTLVGQLSRHETITFIVFEVCAHISGNIIGTTNPAMIPLIGPMYWRITQTEKYFHSIK